MQKFDNLFKSKNIFFIAIIIFILSSFTLYHNREDIFKLFKSENKNLSQAPDKSEENEALFKKQKEETPLLSAKTLLNYVSSLKFPEASIANLEQKPNPDPEEYSVNYIHYLLSVNLLVCNFLQDENYSKELETIKFIPLPRDIKNIITNLEEYNNKYLISKSHNIAHGMEVIFPTNHKWLEKFIKIEKKPLNFASKKQDKLLILEKLRYLINFLYSEKFMQEFVNKDV